MTTSEDRKTPPIHGSEAETLLAFLALQRATFRWKCSGLTDEQLRQGLAPTSMTLAGMILHLTIVEAGWFNLTFAGGIERPGWLGIADPEDDDWAWEHARDYDSDQLWRWYDESVAVSDKVIADAAAGPQGLGTHAANPDEPVSLRWVITHMIEEYARHNGHADLLRQSIDGATGE